MNSVKYLVVEAANRQVKRGRRSAPTTDVLDEEEAVNCGSRPEAEGGEKVVSRFWKVSGCWIVGSSM